MVTGPFSPQQQECVGEQLLGIRWVLNDGERGCINRPTVSVEQGAERLPFAAFAACEQLCVGSRLGRLIHQWN
jgi:hypothetical protein